MRVGLVIYGSIETLAGSYLYDRRLLDHLLVSQGDRAEVISLLGGTTIPAPSAIVTMERSRPHALAGSLATFALDIRYVTRYRPG